jgi:macrolide transport system ATP-binding/permease protein
MTMIQVRKVSKSFGERVILKDIQFDIQKGEKIGLIGWNGAGKTTLVKMLMKELDPDQGSITFIPLHLKIGYLPQSTDQTDLTEEVSEDFFHIISKLGVQKHVGWEGERYRQLSNGERLKLSLASIWSQHPEFLILDEPTNHLDLQGVKWLINEMKSYEGAALIISHDRYFLDETVTKIFELEDGRLTIYEGNYTVYREEKKHQIEKQQREYEKQQRKIQTIEKQVARLKQWSDKAHRMAGKVGVGAEIRQKEYGRVKAKKKDQQVKSKLKRLEQELTKNKAEKPKDEMSVTFHFQGGEKRGKRVVEATELSKQFQDRILFQSSYFYINHGEKVGLLGPNGAGKTTLLKMLLGEENTTSGSLWKSQSLRIAYLSQDVNDLPLEQTVLQYLDVVDRERIAQARTILANVGLKEKVTKPISALSLGECTKVKLVKMILHDIDLLILDEPTNHLDLPSREQLEETLLDFPGTLLVVSHDRYFIEKICNKLLVIDNQQIKRIESGLKEYSENRDKEKALTKNQLANELAIIETKITELLGNICLLTPGTEEYQKIDEELTELMKKKREFVKIMEK